MDSTLVNNNNSSYKQIIYFVVFPNCSRYTCANTIYYIYFLLTYMLLYTFLTKRQRSFITIHFVCETTRTDKWPDLFAINGTR